MGLRDRPIGPSRGTSITHRDDDRYSDRLDHRPHHHCGGDMPESEAVSWADAPVAGRRPCRWSSPIAGTCREAQPRSAVAVSPPAPALARLTGFSRSGRSITLGWLAAEGEALVRVSPSLRLTAESVDHQWTNGVPSISDLGARSTKVIGPAGTSCAAGPLHVLRERRRASAFHALAGRPVQPEHHRWPSEVAWVTPDPLDTFDWTKGRCRRGAR